jgi:hypothetical protein
MPTLWMRWVLMTTQHNSQQRHHSSRANYCYYYYLSWKRKGFSFLCDCIQYMIFGKQTSEWRKKSQYSTLTFWDIFLKHVCICVVFPIHIYTCTCTYICTDMCICKLWHGIFFFFAEHYIWSISCLLFVFEFILCTAKCCVPTVALAHTAGCVFVIHWGRASGESQRLRDVCLSPL